MRKWLSCILLAVLTIGAGAQEPYPELGAKLEEYFMALLGESPDVQTRECDFLISSTQDSLVRQYVALKIYDHYLRSKVMGDDAVAVHISQKWFLSGDIAMKSSEDYFNAQLFTEFNKSSLIGADAPVLMLMDPSGAPVRVPAEDGWSVIYFYDTSCSTCKVETPRLKALVEEGKYPLRVYAVYVGASAESWASYRESLPGFLHAWDPEITSDWQRLYGVLQTPRMFLVNPSGTIVGRNLDTPALRSLLNKEFASASYVYGEPSVMQRYAQFFTPYGDSLNVSHVMEVADYLAARTFGEGNVDAFKQVEGDFLYFLSSQKTEVFRDAAIPFVEKYITRLPDVWTTPADKAQIVSLGRMLAELSGRTPAGSLVPDLTVPGVLRRKPCLLARGSRPGRYALRKLKGDPAYLVFYSPSCSSCKEMLAEVDRMVAENRKVRVLLVDMDALLTDAPEEGAELLDTFDLSGLPMIVELDRAGVVKRRYLSF